MTSILALHVLDEALNDFLSVYNFLVICLNEKLQINIFPVFEFSTWLILLIVGIIILFALSYFASKNNKWIILLAYFYGMLMFANGIGHLAGSLYFSEPIGGIYTSPLLLAASTYLIFSAKNTRKQVS